MATASSPMTIRAKPDEREAFELICDSIGTTSANAVRMFVSAFNKRGVFPFDPSNLYGFSTETLQTMDDAAHGRNPIGLVDGVEAMRKPWILTGSSAACRSGSRPGSRRTTRNAKLPQTDPCGQGCRPEARLLQPAGRPDAGALIADAGKRAHAVARGMTRRFTCDTRPKRFFGQQAGNPLRFPLIINCRTT